MLSASQFCQMAWVVDDLDAAVKQWQETTGIGPFFMGSHIGAMITDLKHRGRSTEIDMSAAVAQAGSLLIELIHQHDGAPSPYRDVYAQGESGLHHIQAFVEDVEVQCRLYEKHGFEVVMTGLLAGQSPVAYVDTRSTIGCMTELMERGGLAEQMYGAVATISADWDGTDPIREMASLLG